MLRNFGVTGLVASLMGVFVLAWRALTPTPELTNEMPNGQTLNGITVSTPAQPGADNTTMPQPQAGQTAAATVAQPGSTMAPAQPAGMQPQQKPMMGMCGQMMKMMMGGKMNQGGQTNQPQMNQPSPAGQQPTSPTQNQPQAIPPAQPTANVARR